MDAKIHAQNFLSQIDGRLAIINFGQKIINIALNDEKIANKFAIIQKKIGEGKPIVKDPESSLFDKIKTNQTIPKISNLPDWLSVLIAAGYLKAKLGIENNYNKINLFDERYYGKLLDTVIDLVDKLEPEFIGQLLIETATSSRSDIKFREKLNQGAEEYNELISILYDDNNETPTKVLAAASPGLGSSGRGGCRACRTSGGRTVCTDISCWVVVIIIVIVIVTK